MAPNPRPIPPELGPHSMRPLSDEAIDLGAALVNDDAVVLAFAAGDEDLAPQLEEARRFAVDNNRSAEWCMRHVRTIDAHLANHQAQRQAWLDEIAEWYDTVTSQLAARRSFFAHHLITYAIDQRVADPDAKTLQLPSGKVATTEKKPVVDLPDTEGAAAKAAQDAKVIEWLRDTFPAEVLEAMEPIKVTEAVLKTGLRKLVVIWELVAVFDENDVEIESRRHWRPMLDDKGKQRRLAENEQVVRRGAVPPVNPTTGEAWEDDVPVEDRVAPHLIVTHPSIEAKVTSNPVLS